MDAGAHEVVHAAKARAAAGPTDQEQSAEGRKAALDTINHNLGILREAGAKTGNATDRAIQAEATRALEALRIADHVVAVNGGPGCVNGRHLPGRSNGQRPTTLPSPGPAAEQGRIPRPPAADASSRDLPSQ